MNPSSLTGFLVVIVAVVWVFVLIPSWSKRGQDDQRIQQERTERTQKIREVRERVAKPTKMVSVARMSMKLSQTRMIFGFTMIAGFLTGVVALADAATLWPLSLAGFVVAAISVYVTRTATKRHAQLLQDSLANRTRVSQSSTQLSAMSAAPSRVEQTQQTNEWTPVALPKPLHSGHIGNLEQPVLAEVKEMPVVQAAPAAMDIDEILRKRRNVG